MNGEGRRVYYFIVGGWKFQLSMVSSLKGEVSPSLQPRYTRLTLPLSGNLIAFEPRSWIYLELFFHAESYGVEVHEGLFSVDAIDSSCYITLRIAL
ncbi:hypothetical protein CH363_11960 [Leptospira haakeii]|uniref:Uncharacterized protein n=1 Tax=Leptospira haakeii TaxID=2023198 RepID=A0ABX4PLH4_9LEPT|nr:hypothetical protein CH363_11960 [Leptospira haakeii]PKA21806.1 hypothetical protein CH377_05560 [Leptospira haakeii]